MQQHDDDSLVAILHETPPLPGDCYDAVSSRIFREKRGRRLYLAAAALLVFTLTLTITAPRIVRSPGASAETTAAVEAELTAIQAYFSEESIDSELDAYALFTPTLFTSSGGTYEQNP